MIQAFFAAVWRDYGLTGVVVICAFVLWPLAELLALLHWRMRLRALIREYGGARPVEVRTTLDTKQPEDEDG